MELLDNLQAPFTRWIVGTGALQEPFVLIDVGVHGGVNDRWQALGDHLSAYGFDPVVEHIAPLQANANGRETYSVMALGGRDGECAVTIPPVTTEASLYQSAGAGESRTVPMKTL